jgi:hypothetical protein
MKNDKRITWQRPEFEVADAIALQALQSGTANGDQQKRALNWIINNAAGTYDWSFRPGDSDRDTNIALGRQFVGQQIVALLNAKIGVLAAQQKVIEQVRRKL